MTISDLDAEVIKQVHRLDDDVEERDFSENVLIKVASEEVLAMIARIRVRLKLPA